MVFSALVIAWRRAAWPTRRSPVCAKPITDGVVRVPSAFAITIGSSPSITATHEFVVPRSIPTTRVMAASSFGCALRLGHDHERRTQQPIPGLVAALQDLHDGPRGRVA